MSNIKIFCNICNKTFFVFKYRKESAKYCSYSCYWQSKKNMTGEKNPNYKGGWIDDHGYKRKMKNGKMIREHREKIEKSLGRKLCSNEIVHHINGDKLDNRIENLKIMTRSDHIKEHMEDLLKGRMLAS